MKASGHIVDRERLRLVSKMLLEKVVADVDVLVAAGGVEVEGLLDSALIVLQKDNRRDDGMLRTSRRMLRR